MSEGQQTAPALRAARVLRRAPSVRLRLLPGGALETEAAHSVGRRRRVLDEVVLKVNAKGKARVHDPRRTVAGTLTSALTWGLFGLAASGGSWTSLAVWAVLGAVCGGLYAYFTEHLLTKSELKRIGGRLGPNTSAIVVCVRGADARRLLAATAPLQPSTASVAAIADDLSAQVFSGAANPVESSSTGAGGGADAAATSVAEHAAAPVSPGSTPPGRSLAEPARARRQD